MSWPPPNDPALNERLFRQSLECGRLLDSLCGKDPDVREVTKSLVQRWLREAEQSGLIRRACECADSALLTSELSEYVTFHGPHLYAALGTEAGVRASVRFRQAALGSYHKETA